MISSIFSAISALIGIPQLIALWSARRQGRAEQRAADDAATVQTLTAERDALAKAGTAEEAAKRGEF